MNTIATSGRGPSSRQPLLAYLAYFREHKAPLMLAILLAHIKHSPVIILPLYNAYILDHVIPSGDRVLLLACLVGMVSLIVMNICLHPIYIRIYSRVRRNVALTLRSRLCERLQQLQFSYYDNANSGRLHSKVMQDVERLEILGKLLVDPILVLFTFALMALGIILWMQPAFVVVVAVFLPVLFFQRAILTRRVEKRYASLRLEQEKLNAEVGEMIEMIGISRAHATEREDLRRVSQRLGQVRDVGVGAEWSQNILQSQIWGTTQLVNISVVVLGAWLAMRNLATVGEIVQFLTLVMMTVGGLTVFVNQLDVVYGAAESMRSILEVLNLTEVEVNEGKPELPTVRGGVEFRDVWFAYPGTERPVLKSINLRVEPDQTIALVGSSGAGKSTFIKLLLGFYSPIQGEILIDGFALDAFDKRSLRRQVGVVTQETFLFNGTLQQNITHGLGEVPMDRVVEAARLAHAHSFIGELEKGFETEIGDRGLKLSGGQKQRIAIARALLRSPRLLILDEATSSLDSQSEHAVREALETLMRDRTTFVIAHRLHTIRNADRILVFDNGEIVEDGRHELLLQKGGVYARLVELQSVS